MDQLQTVEQEQLRQTQEAEQKLPMTYPEFLERFDDSTHAEWVNGEAIIFMPPNTRHQRIVSFLHMLVGLYLQVFKLGEIFEAPYAMRITPEGSLREPDLLFVAAENAHRIGEQKLEGPADLVVEVVSTESVSRDRTDKFYEYQAAGVREYWIIDPRPGVARADFWILDNSGQYSPVPIGPDGTYRSMVLPNFTLDVRMLLAEKLPDPLKAASKMLDRDALLQALTEAGET